MQQFEQSASFPNTNRRHSHQQFWTGVMFALCQAACSGSPAFTCQDSVSGSPSTVGACGTGGTSQTGGSTNTGGARSTGSGAIGGAASIGGMAGKGGEATTGGAAAGGGTSNPGSGSLIANGSFELDFQSATVAATAAPSGWTMVSSNSAGNLLHALQSDSASGVPLAAQGLNVARFDSLTGSSYREAHSDCFPIDISKPITAHYQVYVPQEQLPAGTKASVKLWYYQDAACSIASALRPSDTQTAASNTSVGVWESRQFTPSQTPPSDSRAATLSVRGAYVVGSSCGSAGVDCQRDVIYYDDIAASQ